MFMCAHTMQMCSNSLHHSQHTNASQCPVMALMGNYLGASTLFDRNRIVYMIFRYSWMMMKASAFSTRQNWMETNDLCPTV